MTDKLDVKNNHDIIIFMYFYMFIQILPVYHLYRDRSTKKLVFLSNMPLDKQRQRVLPFWNSNSFDSPVLFVADYVFCKFNKLNYFAYNIYYSYLKMFWKTCSSIADWFKKPTALFKISSYVHSYLDFLYFIF